MTKVQKPKKLTLDVLKKQNKELSKQFEVNIISENGTPYSLLIDEHFKETKIIRLLDDMIKFYDTALNQEKEDERIKMLDLATPYASLLMIKYFTNLYGEKAETNDINYDLTVLNELIDLNFLNKIHNAMPEKEVEKVLEKISEMLDKINKNIELVEQETKKIEDKIQNKEVKEMIQNATE